LMLTTSKVKSAAGSTARAILPGAQVAVLTGWPPRGTGGQGLGRASVSTRFQAVASSRARPNTTATVLGTSRSRSAQKTKSHQNLRLIVHDELRPHPPDPTQRATIAIDKTRSQDPRRLHRLPPPPRQKHVLAMSGTWWRSVQRVGMTGIMEPSALNSSLSTQTSRWVPSPLGIAKR